MTHLPPSVKLKVFIAACVAWVCAGAWLVGCVALDAPLRMGASAGLALAVLSCAVAFVRHDMEMDLVRGRASQDGPKFFDPRDTGRSS